MTEVGSWLANWKLHLQAFIRHADMRLNKMEGIRANLPEACFVIWADVSRLLYPDDRNPEITASGDPAEVELEMELMQWLIREHKVCIIPGLDQFFGPGSTGHIWLSVATSKPVLDMALDRLELGLKLWSQMLTTGPLHLPSPLLTTPTPTRNDLTRMRGIPSMRQLQH